MHGEHNTQESRATTSLDTPNGEERSLLPALATASPTLEQEEAGQVETGDEMR